jgi:hypothetical protein
MDQVLTFNMHEDGFARCARRFASVRESLLQLSLLEEPVGKTNVRRIRKLLFQIRLVTLKRIEGLAWKANPNETRVLFYEFNAMRSE